jgi:P-type conjugative transfer protein TrbG
MTDDAPLTLSPLAQRLDGPEALLTAEWQAVAPPADETADPGAARPGGRAMPPPPSQRRAQAAAAARTGEAGAHQPSALPSRQQGVTVPRPQRPLDVAPAIVINDPGATLPPRDQRAAPAVSIRETPQSVPARRRFGRGRSPFVALVAAVGCTFGYAVWTALLRPTAADAHPAPPLPHFLQDGATNTGAQTMVASVPAAPPPPSALPPELAATLAQALPSTTSETASFTGDAGAPPAPPATAEPPTAPTTNAPSPTRESASPETHRRAAALRAALEAQRAEPRPGTSDSNVETPTAPASSLAPRTPELVTKWPNDPPPRRQRPRREPPLPTEAPSATTASSAIEPVTTYTYRDEAFFAVVTAPMRVTDLVLERGETLVSQPTPGDAARWVISVVPGESQSHVFVKPLRPGLKTNLTLTTNRRSYFLELSTRDDGSYMAAVAWQYPLDEAARRRVALAAAERERQSTTAISDLQALRFDYRIEVTAGSAPWKPTMAFDDGQKTFIRFARPVPPSVAPLLFVLRAGSTKDAKFVNYRLKSDLYVLDRIVDAAELRLATSDGGQDIVRITRLHR